jgi:hypothetical protein
MSTGGTWLLHRNVLQRWPINPEILANGSGAFTVCGLGRWHSPYAIDRAVDKLDVQAWQGLNVTGS